MFTIEASSGILTLYIFYNEGTLYLRIADRQGRTFKRLNELFATTGQVGFLGAQRVDGKLILPEAIKVLKLKGTAASGT